MDSDGYTITGMPMDWPVARAVKLRIARLQQQLDATLADRDTIIESMDQCKLGQREIAAYWGLTQPRVHQILKERKLQRGARGAAVPNG